MVGEDLAYFGDKDGPRNTTEVAHNVGADASIFGPDLYDSQGFLEVVELFGCVFEYHEVILPAEERGLALVILDGAEQVEGDDFFNVPWYGLSLQLTETDIDLNVLVCEGDDRYFGIRPGSQIFNLRF